MESVTEQLVKQKSFRAFILPRNMSCPEGSGYNYGDAGYVQTFIVEDLQKMMNSIAEEGLVGRLVQIGTPGNPWLVIFQVEPK